MFPESPLRGNGPIGLVAVHCFLCMASGSLYSFPQKITYRKLIKMDCRLFITEIDFKG